MFDLYYEFRKLIAALDEHQTDYAVCGGIAMAIYDRPRGDVLSLDLLLVTPEVQQVWNSRVQADWEGGKLSVVSREGLIGLKNMRGSAQDLADISALMEDVDDATN